MASPIAAARAPPATGGTPIAPEAHVRPSSPLSFTPNSLRMPGSQHARASSGPRSSDSDRDLSGVRVVVVEDDPDSRELLVVILSAAGAEVSSAASATAGFALVSIVSPQLLVSDIAMPEEDGFSLIRRVRAMGPEGNPRVPAIALTAFGGDDARQKALNAGFSLHMCKPVNAGALLDAAKRLTSSLSS